MFQASSKKDRHFPGGLYFLLPTELEEKSMRDVADGSTDPGVKQLVNMCHYYPR